MDEHGPLCVGIDPHPSLLDGVGAPGRRVRGCARFALTVLDAVGGRVAAVKPQAAFFERHGSAGVAVLEEVVAAGRDTGTLVIVDAKRGDIGSTMGAYADAFLRDGSPLAGDALTVSPYLGFGSLDPAVDLALVVGTRSVRPVPHLQQGGPRGPARPHRRRCHAWPRSWRRVPRR